MTAKTDIVLFIVSAGLTILLFSFANQAGGMTHFIGGLASGGALTLATKRLFTTR